MHQAPSLAEAPPKSDAPHSEQQLPTNGDTQGQSHNQHHVTNGIHDDHAVHSDGNPAPVRKDTTSSTSTTATGATLATLASNDSTATAYSVDNYPSQAVFSVKDGSDVGIKQHRPTRRRTGPLSAVQRERAALIRKLGACSDCRRRRVACHPNHHNMTWEDAARKFRSHSPSMQADLAPSGQRPLSPAPLNSKALFTHDPQEMDVDVSPTHAGRPPPSDPRIRTPLPSGPRPDKPAAMASLPGVDGQKLSDLQATASRILMSPYRCRYSAASALFVHWQEDRDPRARSAMDELAGVLQHYYNYTFQIKSIPESSDGSKGSSWRWLNRELQAFLEDQDQRDVLKIVYYSGHSYLDADREMVLASSQQADSDSAIKWSYIQRSLEMFTADTLIIMDAAYYPSPKMSPLQGVLELIAASASEDHVKLLSRGAFTRELADQLRTRASQKSRNPLSAAELHAKLFSQYPKMIQDQNPEKQMVTSFPSPLHLQVSGNVKLPSILLVPIQKSPPYATPESPTGGVQLTLTFRLSDDAANKEMWAEKWAECFRWMPEGIRDVRVESPSPRNTFR
jgi:hypothetical protein